MKKDNEKISHLGRAGFSCEHRLEYMKKPPQVTVPLLAKELKMTQTKERSALNHLQSIGVRVEVSGQKRDTVDLYRRY